MDKKPVIDRKIARAILSDEKYDRLSCIFRYDAAKAYELSHETLKEGVVYWKRAALLNAINIKVSLSDCEDMLRKELSKNGYKYVVESKEVYTNVRCGGWISITDGIFDDGMGWKTVTNHYIISDQDPSKKIDVSVNYVVSSGLNYIQFNKCKDEKINEIYSDVLERVVIKKINEQDWYPKYKNNLNKLNDYLKFFLSKKYEKYGELAADYPDLMQREHDELVAFKKKHKDFSTKSPKLDLSKYPNLAKYVKEELPSYKSRLDLYNKDFYKRLLLGLSVDYRKALENLIDCANDRYQNSMLDKEKIDISTSAPIGLVNKDNLEKIEGYFDYSSYYEYDKEAYKNGCYRFSLKNADYIKNHSDGIVSPGYNVWMIDWIVGDKLDNVIRNDKEFRIGRPLLEKQIDKINNVFKSIDFYDNYFHFNIGLNKPAKEIIADIDEILKLNKSVEKEVENRLEIEEDKYLNNPKRRRGLAERVWSYVSDKEINEFPSEATVDELEKELENIEFSGYYDKHCKEFYKKEMIPFLERLENFKDVLGAVSDFDLFLADNIGKYEKQYKNKVEDKMKEVDNSIEEATDCLKIVDKIKGFNK